MKLFITIIVGMLVVGINASENFSQQCAKAGKAIANNSITYQGKAGWLYTGAELRHLAVGKFWGEAASKVSRCRRAGRQDPELAIVDFNRQLTALSIKLIVVPVPPKATVYPEGLGEFSPKVANTQLQAFYQRLTRAGVEVLDLHDKFVALKSGKRRLYCQQDSHWSGYGCEVAADELSKVVSTMPWYKKFQKSEFKAESRQISITGDLWKSLQQTTLAKEDLTLRFIAGQTVVKSSPILLMGDSHTLIFHAGDDMLAKQAGLVDQLAYELKMPVDLLAVRGSGATAVRITLYRHAKRQPAWLTNKKVIIWCFTARDFSEASSGWRKIPVLKKKSSSRTSE